MKRILGLSLSIIVLLSACDEKKEKLFNKVTSAHSGIYFKNQLIDTPELNILNYLYYYNGAGVVSADFNNDGLVDLYFTANQGEDKLYINRGGLKFEDVTKVANIHNPGNWTTGATHVDINHDGLLDIYVCKVANYQGMKGRNLLFINKGANEEGIPKFTEEASSYGLDFSGLSTQAAFLDFDLDGDLDMYLLNHSVHPNRTYGKGSQRLEIDSLSGDRLYRNDDGMYKDVSKEAGIFQGKIGYGLGLGVSDINDDGYPDIYVGNDFFENDYLYINQRDGTFKELISSDNRRLGHTTHYSMGNDLADVNNDGLTDILSLDMLPEDLETYKTSGLEYSFPTYQYYLKNGYAPQYMQNTLHLNLGTENFSEIGNLSGISATEWSWGVLTADYDNDGYKDIYISNGIKGATNDMDFISYIANENIQKRISAGMTETDMAFIKELPEKKVANYLFKNNKNLSFKNVTKEWYKEEVSFSNGCVFADLDNDG
ncbi:MAG: VCBS repeat-containing protein, partial [Eudoraea sp.]|uniref:FG-GAP repeat domain-containing protein n=1 Tax=Eudoraea sp. TaxID=1979955 RepID=UPI003C74D2F3